MKHYGKLVRGRIPEIIEASDRQYAISPIPTEEFHQALREKLIEEAQEAAVANPDELIKELADLYEVIDTPIAAYQIERSDVLREQKARRNQCGGFHEQAGLFHCQKWKSRHSILSFSVLEFLRLTNEGLPFPDISW